MEQHKELSRDFDPRDWQTTARKAQEFLQHIEDCAIGSLSPAAAKILTADDAAELKRALERLRPAFDELAKWFIDPMREGTPSRATYGYEKLWEFMAAAFVIGSRGTVTDSAKTFFTPQIKNELDRKRVGPANEARKKTDIQELIEKLATGLWAKKPSFKNNASGTAKEIWPPFNKEVATWTEKPRNWQPADPNNAQQVEKETEIIRKRVSRIGKNG